MLHTFVVKLCVSHSLTLGTVGFNDGGSGRFWPAWYIFSGSNLAICDPDGPAGGDNSSDFTASRLMSGL